MTSQDRTSIWTASNVITITRILLVPVFVAALLAPWPEWFGMNNAFSNDWKSIVAAAIFVLISCTDWLDGYLARSRNEVTDFGKFMDPLADKILVTAALIALVELGSLPTWVVLIILAREFIVSGVRMMAASNGTVIAASMLGKFKTVFQMIAIVLFVIKDSHMIGGVGEAFTDVLWDVSWLVMMVAVALTIASMIDYLVKARELIGLGSSSRGEKRSDSSGVAEAETVQLEDLAKRVVQEATKRSVTLATAESLTGGLIGTTITEVPGSSSVFRGGVISYSSDVKHSMLDVSEEDLNSVGPVSEVVCRRMAQSAREKLEADIAVSVTGIAGPGGAEPGKPVGTVWIGLSTKERTDAVVVHLPGSRAEVREATCRIALQSMLDEMLGTPE